MGNLQICDVVEIKNVRIGNSFLGNYCDLVRNTVLPYQWEILNDRIKGKEPSHAVLNFKIAAGLAQGDFYGEVFQDSDLAKWLEAVACSLEAHPDPELENIADGVIEIIEKAQREDGYLDTYFIIGSQEKRWEDLYECHELYCMGHMTEAAVAYYKATGKRRLLDVMIRCADYIDRCFGRESGKLRGYPGHQEIELALVRLYEVTDCERYLTLSRYFLEERGRFPNYFVNEWKTCRGRRTFKDNTYVGEPNLLYNQSHRSVYEQESAVGHSVRAMYMYSAMADVARITDDAAMYQACQTLWKDVVCRQMYITGAIGSTHTGEAFTFAYDLPNATAYAETCASIGLIFFASRMLQMDIDGVYGDVMERVLYNVIPGSMSLDGKHFFYVNPLEVWPEASEKNPERFHVKPVRQEWFGCACCPPNLARLFTSLGKYLYSSREDTLYIHLFVSSQVTIKTDHGVFRLNISENYPWSGEIDVALEEVPSENAQIAIRIPGWCREWKLFLDGEESAGSVKKGYVWILGGLKAGMRIRLILSMQVELVVADPKVRDDAGKAAIRRGPVIYCLEEIDNGKNLSAIRLDLQSAFCLEEGIDPTSLDTAAVTGGGFRLDEDSWGDELYRPYDVDEKEVTVRAVPYCCWGNRGLGEMMVWIRT